MREKDERAKERDLIGLCLRRRWKVYKSTAINTELSEVKGQVRSARSHSNWDLSSSEILDARERGCEERGREERAGEKGCQHAYKKNGVRETAG